MKNILLSLGQLAGMQTVIALTGLVRNKVLALRLEPAGFGEFTQIIVVVSIGYTLVSFGLGTGVSRNIAAAKTHEERQRHLATANFIVLALTALCWLVFLPALMNKGVFTTVGLVPDPENMWAVVLLVGLTPLEAIKNNYLAFLTGVLDIKGIASGRSFAVIAGTVVSVPIVWFMGILGAAIQMFLLVGILALILGRRCSQLGYKPLKIHWHKPSAVVLGSLGVASLANGFAQNFTDALIRRELISQTGIVQNGFYQAAASLAGQVQTIILGSVGSYSMATLTQKHERAAMSEAADKLLRVIIPVAALSLGLLGLAGYVFLFLLYSPSFTPAMTYFPFMLGGDFLQAFVWVVGAPLLALGHTGKWVVLGVSFSGVKLFLAMILLPYYGGVAIVLAYVMASVMMAAANSYVFVKVFKLRLNPARLRELCLSLPMVMLLPWLVIKAGQTGYSLYVLAVVLWLAYAFYALSRNKQWEAVRDYFRRKVRVEGRGGQHMRTYVVFAFVLALVVGYFILRYLLNLGE